MKISDSNDDTPQLPEHWVNAQSLQWLHQDLKTYEAMADHISIAVYTGQLHKIRVDTEALICAVPAMMINGSAILLQLNFQPASQGGWDLASITLDDGENLTLLAAPGQVTLLD